jgi:hypothetical protein
MLHPVQAAHRGRKGMSRKALNLWTYVKFFVCALIRGQLQIQAATGSDLCAPQSAVMQPNMARHAYRCRQQRSYRDEKCNQ